MSDTKGKEYDTDERLDAVTETEAAPRNGAEAAEAEATEPQAPAEPADGAGASTDLADVEILRAELVQAEERLAEAGRELEEMRDRFLRARADLDNFRRRAAAEQERAREAGLDSAVLPVLTVFDDLQRALQVADDEDPGQIIPGVRAVLATLERNLGSLGIQGVGEVGEQFDPSLHEAIGVAPASPDGEAGTIAQVYQRGFAQGERLIRPARVVVYQA